MTNAFKKSIPPETDFDKIQKDLVVENEFLTMLIDTIPAKIYFDNDIQEKIMTQKHFLMNEKAIALKRGFSQVELSAKGKHKRSRVDPLCQKNVTQIHQELDGKKKRKSKKNRILQNSASLTRATNIEELQKRLREHIKDLQLKRNAVGRTNADESMKLSRRLKKMKTKANKVKKEKQVLNPHKEEKAKKKEKKIEKPMYNKEGNILYGKLDFSEDGEIEKKKSEFSGKNYKKLLNKVEKKKEKIEKLKSDNPELANSLEEKEKWKKALLKAENIKVKDDPTLLKKSIKKQDKIKKKKSKEWKERTELVESKKKAKQEKRARNIKQKKQEKLDHKIKRAKKKGRVITGI